MTGCGSVAVLGPRAHRRVRAGRRGRPAVALVRGVPDRDHARRARSACRCRWAPTGGSTSRRWPPRSRRGPRSCSSARRTTRPVRRCTPTSWRPSSRPCPSDVLVVLDEAYVEFVRDPAGRRRARRVRRPPERRPAAHVLQGVRAGRAARRATPSLGPAWPPGSAPRRRRSGSRTSASSPRSRRCAPTPELLARVDQIVVERTRLLAGLRKQGWTVPDSEANFVWLALGDQASRVRGAGRAGRACWSGRSPATACGSASASRRPPTCFLEVTADWLAR